MRTENAFRQSDAVPRWREPAAVSMLGLRLLYGVCAHLKAAHESIKQNRKEQKNTAVVETAGRTV